MSVRDAVADHDRIQLLGLGAISLGAFAFVTGSGGFAAQWFVRWRLSLDGFSFPPSFPGSALFLFVARYEHALLVGHLSYAVAAIGVGLGCLRRLTHARSLLETFVWVSLVVVTAYTAWFGVQFRGFGVDAFFPRGVPELQPLRAVWSTALSVGAVLMPIVIAAAHVVVIGVLRSRKTRAAFDGAGR